MTAATPTATSAGTLPHFPMVIGGQRVQAVSGRRYETVDPFRGAPWATTADAGAADVDLAVRAAREALAGPWGRLTGFGRAKLLRTIGDLIARDADYLAELETRDTGKLAREMRGQLATIPEWFYYYAGLADKLEGTTIPADKPNFLVYTRREPAGVVAAIVPWNSPLLLLCWKLAPALAAGCTVVAKPNGTRYGLAGAVWTKDIHRGHRVAHALKAGTVWINAYRVVGPDVPFGGYGLSGIGRENGIEAVREYTQTKAIWVELTGGTRDPFTLG
jgi:acyl-CoA reductase-like NAD-dependent aldehyde dehydrogenase